MARKTDNQKEIIGSSSLETLTHFQCGTCTKWWAIGDVLPNKHDWYCPWCGQQQSTKPLQ